MDPFIYSVKYLKFARRTEQKHEQCRGGWIQVEIDELNLLLTLNGGSRLPHLEVEIFANESLTGSYLRYLSWNRLNLMYDNYVPSLSDLDDKVLDGGAWWDDTEIQCRAIYCYSIDIIRDRWVVAEHILQKPYIPRYGGETYTKLYNTCYGTNF